jgi:hypothetical protein
VPFAIFLLFLTAHADSSRVRKIEVKNDQIVTIRTAIGVATIIQVPDRPTSLVVGDSEAFKIEYLDQAITIKPLRSNAKSNLYIYTDWKRFNVQLVTGPEAAADYVVYLAVPRQPEPKDVIAWREVNLNSRLDDLGLSIRRLGRLNSEYVFIEFTLSGKKTEVDPKWFWIMQKGTSKPIHRLLLSTLSLNQEAPIEGLLQVRLKDLSRSDGIALEIKRKKSLALKIPKEILWR